MYKRFHITVVIPCYNEERFIGQTVSCIPSLVDVILVIDDCSQDGTSRAAESLNDKRVVVLKTACNQGVGGATMLGYQKALEIGSDIVVKMDGDGQMSPEYLPDLLDPIAEDGYMYTKGNRFLCPEALPHMPRHRLFGNVVLTFMNKLSSGYWHIFDPCNGYTAISTEILRKLDMSAIHKRYFFESDMLIQLNWSRALVKDVPMKAKYGGEESGLNPLKIGFTFPFLMLRKFFYRVYKKYVLIDFSPIALFLFLGLTLFCGGTLFGLYLWIRSLITENPTPVGTIMLALVPMILGFQLLLQAIVLDIQDTPR